MNNQIIKSLVILLGFLVFNLLSFVSADQGSTKPSLFLLTNYQKHNDINGWVMSEKLDGIRAYWDGKQLLTRKGNVIHAPRWFIKDLPVFELDGELWLARNKYFETQAIVLDQTPSKDWRQITYQVFEVPNQTGGLLKRLQVLKDFMASKSLPYINIIEQITIKDHSQVRTQLQKVLGKGGEGLVIRDPTLPYVTGRQKGIQKVKLKQDAECRVMGYVAGKGKYTGLVGALECEILEPQRKRLFPMLNQQNRVIRIGSGLNDLQRKSPPEIGKVITFQYIGLTKNGLPRFPVFLRERKTANQ